MTWVPLFDKDKNKRDASLEIKGFFIFGRAQGPLKTIRATARGMMLAFIYVPFDSM